MQLSLLGCTIAVLNLAAIINGAGVCDPVDIVLVVDGSLSIGTANFILLKQEIVKFVRQTPVTPDGVHMSVILYSTDVKASDIIPFSGNEALLTAQITNLAFPGGNTLTNFGIDEGIKMMQSGRPNVPKKLVVITDGYSNLPAETIKSASKLSASGIESFALGVGTAVVKSELDIIASNNPANARTATDFSAVYQTLQLLSINKCNDPTTTIRPTTAKAVNLPVPRIPSNCAADVVFIVDASNSATTDNVYGGFMDAIRNFIIQQPISDNDLRLGFVFTNDVTSNKIVISGNKFDLFNKVNNNLAPIGGALSLVNGINGAIELFSQDTTNRNVPRITILITAGKSDVGGMPFFQSNNLKALTNGGQTSMSVYTLGISTTAGKAYNNFELNIIASGSSMIQELSGTNNLLAVISGAVESKCKPLVVLTTTQISSTRLTSTVPTTLALTTLPPTTAPPTLKPDCALDIVFIVDASDVTKGGNVYSNFLQSLTNFIARQTMSDSAVRVGVVFTNDVQAVEIPLSGNKAALLNQINSFNKPLGGGQKLGNGIKGAINVFTQDQLQRNAPRATVLLTSGRSKGGAIPITDATNLKSLADGKSMTVYSIGVTSLNGIFYNENELNAIASNPNQVITLPDTNAVLPNFNNIATSECRVIPKTNLCKATDIVLIVDGSMSIGMDAFESLKSNLVKFAKDSQISPGGIHFGVVTFSSRVTESDNINYTGDIAALEKAIMNLPYPEGGTRTDLGIDQGRLMSLQLGRQGANQVMIVITDGYSDEPDLTKSTANAAKSMGIDVYVLGVGNGVQQQELEGIASSTDKVKRLSDFNLIIPSFLQLGRAICQTPPAPLTTLMTTLVPPPPTPAPGCAADIVFIIDASDVTKGGDLYGKFVDTVTTFLNQQKISNSELRVGVVFANDVQNVNVGLSRDKNVILSQIGQLKQLGGGLRLANGINGAVNMFNTDVNNRNVPRVAVLLTVGRSKGGAVPTTEANELKTLTGGGPMSVYSIAINSINGPFYNQLELDTIASSASNIDKYPDTTPLLQRLTTIANDNCKVMQVPNYCDPTDIVLVVDGSMSIGTIAFERLKVTLVNFTRDLPVSPNGINVGMVLFSSTVNPSNTIPLSGDFGYLSNAISSLPYPEGGTRTDLGIEAGGNVLLGPTSRPGVKKVMIVITDGFSDNPPQTRLEANTVKANRNVDVYALGVGNGVVKQELNDIASAASNVKTFDNFNLIIPSFLQLGRSVCITPKPPTTIITTILTTLPPTTTMLTTTPIPTTTTALATTIAPTTTTIAPTTTTIAPTTTTVAPTTTTIPPTTTTIPPTTPTTTMLPTTTVLPTTTDYPTTEPLTTTEIPTTEPPTTTFEPSTTPNPECAADIVFVVDSSDITKSGGIYEDFVQTIQTFIDQNDVSNSGKRVGVVFTNDKQAVKIPLSGDKAFLGEALGNNTNQLGRGLLLGNGLNGAIDVFNNNGLNRNVPRVTIALTVGRSRRGVIPAYEAEALKRLDGDQAMSVHSIGVESVNGPNYNEEELKTIASDSGNVQLLPNTQSLLQTITDIANAECKVITDQDTDCNPRDIVLVVDGSASIGDAAFTKLKANLVDFINKLQISPAEDNVGVVVYSSAGEPNEVIPLTDNPVTLAEDINNLIYLEGGTMTNQGIDTGNNILQGSSRSGTNKIMVVITDGHSDLPPATLKSATKAKALGTNVYTIGVGNGVEDSELIGIASSVNNVKRAPNFDTIDIPLVRSSNATCEPSCPVDVVFIVDASDGTKSGDIYKKFLQSINSLIRQQNIANVGTRVGVVFTNNQAAETIKISLSGDRSYLQNEINNNQVQLGNGLLLENGLNGAKEVFSNDPLYRNAHRVAIVLTAGRSQRGAIPTAEANQLKTLPGEPISVYSMGVTSPSGNLYNPAELTAIASNPPNDVFQVSDINDLLSNYNQIIDGTCALSSPPTPYTTAVPSTTEPTCTTRDIVFVVDGSQSIGLANFDKLKQNILTMTRGMSISDKDVHVGVVVYSSGVVTKDIIPLTGDRAILETAISNLPYPEAGTETHKGINAGANMLENGRGGDKTMIVITDGYSDNLTDTQIASAAAKANGEVIYAVGVGGGVLDSELNDIASQPEFVSKATNFDSVLQNLDLPAISICDPPSTTPAPDCADPLDVVIVMDGSGSVGATNYELMKQTVADLLPDLNVKPSVVNVGLVLYSDRVYDVLPLSGDATTRANEITAMAFPKSVTRTDLGLLEAVNMVETTGRAGVPAKIIVITDGVSTEKPETVKAAGVAHAAGQDVYAIGVGQGPDRPELDTIASTLDQVKIAPTFGDLAQTLRDIIQTLCKKK